VDQNVLEVEPEGDSNHGFGDQKSLEKGRFLSEFRRSSAQKKENEEAHKEVFMVPAQDFGHGFLEVFPSEIYAYGIPFVKGKKSTHATN
jgi:hypothetical protein